MRLLSVACILLMCSLLARADGVIVSAEAPGVQTSQVTGVTLLTETFDGFALGDHTSLTTAVGTITAPTPGANIHAADQFGGAGGTGRYFAIGNESGQTAANLTLDTGSPQRYLGLWLSALDANNIIELYSGTTLVAHYDQAAVLGFLHGNSAYFGNPTAPFLHQDPNEPFVYLNFTATGATTFDSVKLSNPIGTGLEIDNISISADVIENAPGTPIGTPLPSTAWGGMLLLAGVAGAMGWRKYSVA